MRILLTGIIGQVGGALRPRLKPFGEVIAADETVLDFLQLADITNVLDRFRPDLIINPAAYTAVGLFVFGGAGPSSAVMKRC